jgi:hypothetical protein
MDFANYKLHASTTMGTGVFTLVALIFRFGILYKIVLPHHQPYHQDPAVSEVFLQIDVFIDGPTM